MASVSKEFNSEHSEHHPRSPATDSEDAQVTGFEADEENLPKGYFYSRFFIGTFLAIGLSLWAGTGAL